LQLLEKSVELCGGEIFEYLWGLKTFFTKISTTFSYGIRITKFLARWKACCEVYVMTWSRVYFGCLLFLHLVIFKKIWFMLLGFSCDGTCLSWIEFIFGLCMWASILVYLFEVYVMTWSRVYFWLCIVSSSCDLQKDMVHASRFLLWWHMSLMDRVHLWSLYVSLYIGISFWSHCKCYGGYGDGYLGIYLDVIFT